MSDDKKVSKESFVAGHVGVIAFHVIIGALLLYSQSTDTILGASSTTFVRILAIILIVISLLGLIPVLMKNTYIIS